MSTRPLSQSLQGYLPGWEFNSKRIALVADAAMIVERSNQSVRCLEAVLFFFRLAAGRVPTATPLQKNQLAAPPRFCFCCAGVVTCCFYCLRRCLLLLLCQYISRCRASFSKPSKIKGLRFSVGRRRAQKNRVPVTDEPGFCYAVRLR